MASFARISILGRAAAEPEQKYTANGNPMASFSVAVSIPKRQGDEWTEVTNWYRVTAFGNLAEKAIRQIYKGREVEVTGRFEARDYVGRDGLNKISLDLVATDLNGLGAKKDASVPTAASTDDDLDLPF